MSNEIGDWKELGRLVVTSIERLERRVDDSHTKVDRMDDKLTDGLLKYNETLIRNTATLEEHIRRTNLLEKKTDHIEIEVDGLKSHVSEVEIFFKLFKVVTPSRVKFIAKVVFSIGAFLGTVYMGVKEILDRWF